MGKAFEFVQRLLSTNLAMTKIRIWTNICFINFLYYIISMKVFQVILAVYLLNVLQHKIYNKHGITSSWRVFSATMKWLRYGEHTWGVARTSTPPVPIGSAGCSKVARPTPVSAIFSFFYLHRNTKIHTKNKIRALGLPNSEFNIH